MIGLELNSKINKLRMLAGQSVVMYNDKNDKETYTATMKVSKNEELSITIQPNGGFLLTK